MCKHERSKVLYTHNKNYRRRICLDCGARWATYEIGSDEHARLTLRADTLRDKMIKLQEKIKDLAKWSENL